MCMHASGPYHPKTKRVSAAPDPKGIDATLSAVGDLVSQRMRDDAMDYRWDFLWKYREGNKRVGICGRCGHTQELKKGDAHRSGSAELCPGCGKALVAKDARRKRGDWAYQQFYLMDWRRLPDEPDAIAMVGAEVTIDCRGEHPERVGMNIWPSCVAIFRFGGGAVVYKRRKDWVSADGGWIRDRPTAWMRARKFSSLRSYGMSAWKLRTRDAGEDLLRAMEGTRFLPVWEALNPERREGCSGKYLLEEHYLHRIAQYPCVEYLVKMGQHKLAKELLYEEITALSFNPRGKTAQQVLGLNAQRLAEMKRDKVLLTSAHLGAIRMYDKCRVNAGVREIVDAGWSHGDHRWIEASLNHMPEQFHKKALRYILKLKQMRGKGVDGYIRDLRDYWADLLKLEADWSDEQVVFPRDLDEAHIRATARIKYLGDKLHDRKIKKLLPKLMREYAFSHGALTLTPLKSAGEVIREGTALRHCVGGYVASYAEGRTILCALRRADEPDIPYRTVEFSTRDGRMVQCRGYKNQSPKEEQQEIDRFFEAWKQFKASKKKERETA